MPKKQGFASLSRRKHRKLSSLGGQAKVPKGYASLNEEQRRANGRKAATIRWERVRLERELRGEAH